MTEVPNRVPSSRTVCFSRLSTPRNRSPHMGLGESAHIPQATHLPHLCISKGPRKAQPQDRLWEARVKGQLQGSKTSLCLPPQAAMLLPPTLPHHPPLH